MCVLMCCVVCLNLCVWYAAIALTYASCAHTLRIIKERMVVRFMLCEKTNMFNGVLHNVWSIAQCVRFRNRDRQLYNEDD